MSLKKELEQIEKETKRIREVFMELQEELAYLEREKLRRLIKLQDNLFKHEKREVLDEAQRLIS